MHSPKQESQSSREPSTYEQVADLVDDSKPRIQLWRHLSMNEYTTQKEILDSNDTAERFNSRGNLSSYLGDLREKGIVKRVSQDGSQEPDLWFVTDEYQPEPEKIVEERTVVETEEVPRYESLDEWIEDHAILLGPLVFLLFFGGAVATYEVLVVPIGSWPETIAVGSLLGILSALGVGIKEVYR